MHDTASWLPQDVGWRVRVTNLASVSFPHICTSRFGTFVRPISVSSFLSACDVPQTGVLTRMMRSTALLELSMKPRPPRSMPRMRLGWRSALASLKDNRKVNTYHRQFKYPGETRLHVPSSLTKCPDAMS